MSELTIERVYPAPKDMVFAFLTKPENLIKWWGPESMHVTEHTLDFTGPGPWHSVMVNAEGQRYKVSGQVVSVDPHDSLELTWGWHDDADARGAESRVKFSLTTTDTGDTALTLQHSELADDEAAKNHKQGWLATLVKLDRMAMEAA